MRLVDDHAAHRQREAEPRRALGQARVQPDRVAGALVAKELGRARGGGVEVRRAVEREHRRELLARKRRFRSHGVDVDDEEPRRPARVAPEPGQRCDRRRRLRDERRRELAVREHRPLEPRRLVPRERHPAVLRKLGAERLRHRLERDHAVLRRAGGRVVERLRPRDLGGCVCNVRRLVDDDRHVAGAHAERGRAARVGGAHVVLRSGGHDEIGLAHQLPRVLARHRHRQHLHEVARRADAVELGVHVVDQPRERRRALRRRGEHDRVARLQCVDDVVRRRGARVGRRRDRGDDARRPRDLDQAPLAVLGDDAGGADPREVAQEAHRLAPVLGDLVGDVAHAGVAHRQLGERAIARRLDDRPRRRDGELVGARLVAAVDRPLRRARAGDEGPDVVAHARCVRAAGGPPRAHSGVILASRIT